jgi:hypothetical protein
MATTCIRLAALETIIRPTILIEGTTKLYHKVEMREVGSRNYEDSSIPPKIEKKKIHAVALRSIATWFYLRIFEESNPKTEP